MVNRGDSSIKAVIATPLSGKTIASGSISRRKRQSQAISGGIFFLALIAFSLAGGSGLYKSVPPPAGQATVPAFDFSPTSRIVVDPLLTIGRLPNGLSYWIRENSEPKNRAELRLIVKAGSVLEDDDQRGLAHMVEHMAFNGTTNFPRKSLLDMMQTIGMGYMTSLNAFSSFDQTVYALTVPTDSPEILQKSFLILRDWADGITFDPAAVDKERRVVVEEWRQRLGTEQRILAKQFPVLFHGSRYAERSPIGDKESIEGFDPEALKRFYRTWYRPDLMAVVAVGDFKRAGIEVLIRQCFEGFSRPADAPLRPSFELPDHNEILVSVATDKEQTRSTVSVFHKLPGRVDKTAEDYRRAIVEQLFDACLNARLAEAALKPGSPFIRAGSGLERFVAMKDIHALSAIVPQGGILRGLQALAAEGERVRRFGFSASEIEREKRGLMRVVENAFAERATRDSNSYTQEFTRGFLQDEPTPGVSYEYFAFRHFLPEIMPGEVGGLASERLTDSNRIILVSAPDEEAERIPGESELTAAIENLNGEELTPYTDTPPPDRPLLARVPESGRIVSAITRADLGITRWTLSNGVQVILKPTNFKNDEILVRAWSEGGIFQASYEDLFSAMVADNLIASSGLAGFSAADLRKKLTGTTASVLPEIGELEEGLRGEASPCDAETLLQLIYLTFTAPRADAGIFEALKTQLAIRLEKQAKSPEAALSEALQAAIHDDQSLVRSRAAARALKRAVNEVAKMDLSKSLAFYRDRFADASDFMFIFVGKLDIAALKPLVLHYLASLPSLRRIEFGRDIRSPLPKGVVKKKVTKDGVDKSLTTILFSGPFDYTLENRNVLRAASQILEMRLWNLLRDTIGGTYDIDVQQEAMRIPHEEYRVTIGLSADPKRIDELSEMILLEIKKLQVEGPEEQEIEDYQMAIFREYETNCRKNEWWLDRLIECYRLREDPSEILKIRPSLTRVTMDTVRTAAAKYLDTKQYVQVTLYPENIVEKQTK